MCCFFFHYISAKFHLWPSSGDLPRPRIGMMSLVIISPVIIAFHSCCLSHHVFDQVNLWPAWVGFETAIIRQCPPGTVETQRLHPLRYGPRRAIKDGCFGLIILIWSSIVGAVPNICNCLWLESFWDEASLIWELIFIYRGLFVLILVVFYVLFLLSLRFGQISTTTMEGSNYWGYDYKTHHSYPRSR